MRTAALALGLPLLATSLLRAGEGPIRLSGQLTLNQPTHDLGRDLDHQSGFGLGLHTRHRHGDHHTSRTRFDWNVWAQGPAVNGVKTQVSNYHLAFDHLYHFQEASAGPYLVGGLGAVRWFVDRDVAGVRLRSHTTKLGVTAGAGWQFNRAAGLELRALVGSLDHTFDATTLQVAFTFRF